MDTNTVKTKEDWWVLLDLYWNELSPLIIDTLDLNSYQNFFQRKNSRVRKLNITKDNLLRFKEEKNPEINEFLLLTVVNIDKNNISNLELVEVLNILLDSFEKVYSRY